MRKMPLCLPRYMAEVGFESGGFIWVLIGGFKKHLLRFCVDLRSCVCVRERERERYPDCHINIVSCLLYLKDFLILIFLMRGNS